MCVDVGARPPHATAQADVGPLGCSILHRPALRVSRACCGPHLRDAQLCGSSFAARRASPALLTTRSFAVVMLLPNALDLRAVRPRLLEADLEFSLPSRGVCVSWYVAHASSIGRHPASHLLLCAEALVEDHLLFVAGSEELDPVVRVGVARLQGLDLLHACGGVLQREAWVHGRRGRAGAELSRNRHVTCAAHMVCMYFTRVEVYRGLLHALRSEVRPTPRAPVAGVADGRRDNVRAFRLHQHVG